MAKQAAKAKANSGKPVKAGRPAGKSAKPAARKPLLARKPADTGRRQEPKRNFAQRLWDYLKAVRSELAKVIWPKRPEITTSTIIVIVTLIVLGMYVFALDSLFEGIINLISGAGALPR